MTKRKPLALVLALALLVGSLTAGIVPTVSADGEPVAYPILDFTKQLYEDITVTGDNWPVLPAETMTATPWSTQYNSNGSGWQTMTTGGWFNANFYTTQTTWWYPGVAVYGGTDQSAVPQSTVLQFLPTRSVTQGRQEDVCIAFTAPESGYYTFSRISDLENEGAGGNMSTHFQNYAGGDKIGGVRITVNGNKIWPKGEGNDWCEVGASLDPAMTEIPTIENIPMNAGDVLRVETTCLSEESNYAGDVAITASVEMTKTADRETTVSPGTQYSIRDLAYQLEEAAKQGVQIPGTDANNYNIPDDVYNQTVTGPWQIQEQKTRDSEWITGKNYLWFDNSYYMHDTPGWWYPGGSLKKVVDGRTVGKLFPTKIPGSDVYAAMTFTAPETGVYQFGQIPENQSATFEYTPYFKLISNELTIWVDDDNDPSTPAISQVIPNDHQTGVRIMAADKKVWPQDEEWAVVSRTQQYDIPTLTVTLQKGETLRIETCGITEQTGADAAQAISAAAMMTYLSPIITSDVNTIDRTNNTVTVDPGKVSDVIAGFDAHGYELKVFNGETEVGADQAVASGMTLKLFVYGTAYDTLTLTVRPEYVVTEKYLDEDGNEAQASTSTSVIEGSAYSKTAPTIDNYTYVGYKINGGDLQQGNPSIAAVSAATEVTFVYRDKRIADLSALSVEGYTLTPDFAADTTEYTVSVPNSVTSVTITATPKSAQANAVVEGTTTDLVVGQNTATVTVTAEDGTTTKKYTIVITREAPVAVEGVTLNKSETTLVVGGEETLTATVTPDNAADKSVTWESSDPTVATVENGKITALKAGTTTITVKTTDGEFTATCTVTVNPAPVAVTGVTLNKDETTLTVGGEETLTATVAPDNATDKSVTWESSDPTVATVENGKITALKAGTTTITVKTADGEFTATCVVTVEEEPGEPSDTTESSDTTATDTTATTGDTDDTTAGTTTGTTAADEEDVEGGKTGHAAPFAVLGLALSAGLALVLTRRNHKKAD